mmetsp:Transcript_82518/g.231426  ORF Transcript_82518/g.231426 Transcript_82518/m.231426 type:complete len:86 (+) Transcript_82518:289-546(+)
MLAMPGGTVTGRLLWHVQHHKFFFSRVEASVDSKSLSEFSPFFQEGWDDRLDRQQQRRQIYNGRQIIKTATETAIAIRVGVHSIA